MKIGIIVHSQTGHTYYVAEKLKEKLIMTGHSVGIERIIPDNEKQTNAAKIHLKSIPDIKDYDALILGCPVRGASISPALLAYLTQLDSFGHKKIMCFVTEFFPFPWMGGNSAIVRMRDICLSKDAFICGTGVINWSNLNRKNMICDVTEKLSSLV